MSKRERIYPHTQKSLAFQSGDEVGGRNSCSRKPRSSERGVGVYFFVFIFFLSCLSLVEARGTGGEKFKHADKNKDGTIDKKEWKMEESWEHRQKSKVNTWWENRADTNNDARVDADELSSWKKLEKERIDFNHNGVIDAKERRLCWRHARSRVNTALEDNYDQNQDGWLQPEEARQLLEDRYVIIKSQGKAKVDTPLEADYDTNADGVIDLGEAKELKEDLGLD